MKIRATKFDFFGTFFGIMFSLGSSFLLLPFILMYLNKSEVGIWYIFIAINGLTSLFVFGFDPTFARNIAYAWSGVDLTATGAVFVSNNAKINYRLLKLFIFTSRILYAIISSVLLLVVSTVGTMYELYITRHVSETSHLIA